MGGRSGGFHLELFAHDALLYAAACPHASSLAKYAVLQVGKHFNTPLAWVIEQDIVRHDPLHYTELCHLNPSDMI